MQSIQSISGLSVTDTRDAVDFLVRRFDELSSDPSRADQEGLEFSDFSPLVSIDEHLPGVSEVIPYVTSLAALEPQLVRLVKKEHVM